MEAVILCGGRGERLRPFTDAVPKCLVDVAGRPFLRWVLDVVFRVADHVTLLTGYLGDAVEREFADDSRVRCVRTPDAWNTGQRLFDCSDLPEEFLLLYCDNYVPIDLRWMLDSGANMLVTRRPNGNTSTSGGLVSQVVGYGAGDRVDLGFMRLRRDEVPRFDDLKDSVRDLVQAGYFRAFDPCCPYWSVGDAVKLERAAEFFSPNGILLVDRDGVINERAPDGEYVVNRADFVWKDISYLGGRRVVVITNQACVARGICSMDDVASLHSWMVDQCMRRFGVRVVDILTCPHSWDDVCDCRKPMPGMLWEAMRRFNAHCVEFVGDDDRDRVAAERALCSFRRSPC